MSSEKVARLLADFDRPEPQKTRSRVVPFDHALHSPSKASVKPAFVPPPPPEDDGYDRGRAEGYASALAEYEQKLDTERHNWSIQLDEERASLRNEAAARIAGDIAEIGNQLEAKIAGVVARILEPLISSAVQKQAAATFVERLSSITSDSRRPVLRITGPADLLELVRSKLGVRSIAVELRAGSTPEVSITVDQVVLETQVAVWAERLKFAVMN